MLNPVRLLVSRRPPLLWSPTLVAGLPASSRGRVEACDQGLMRDACGLLVYLAALRLHRFTRADATEIDVSLVGRRWSVLSPHEAALSTDCQNPLAVTAGD